MQFSDRDYTVITKDDGKRSQPFPGVSRQKYSQNKSRTRKPVAELLLLNEIAQEKIIEILEIKEPENRQKSAVQAAMNFASSILSQMESEMKILQKEIFDLEFKLQKFNRADTNPEEVVDNVLLGLCPSSNECYKSRKRSLQTSPEPSQTPIKTPRYSFECDSDTET